MNETQHQSESAPPSQVPEEIQSAPKIAVATAAPGELIATGIVKLEAAHSKFAEFHEGYVSRYIGLADTKAAGAFAVSSGSIAYIVGNIRLQTFLLQPAWNPHFVLSITTFALLITSALCSFRVIAPRFSSSGEGIVYFGAVANRKSADDFVCDVASRGEGELTEARLKHCYDISRICVRKYEYLGKAIVVGVAALAGLAGMLLVK
jgi:hypothetical protein